MEHMSWWRFCFSDLQCLWSQFLLLTQVLPWCYCIWEKEWISSSSFSLFISLSLSPYDLSPSPLPSSPHFSLLESNKKKDLSVFWASFLFLEMLVLETMRRKLMHHLPVFHSPHAFTGWWWGWVGEIASLAIAHSPAEERGCAVVVAMVEELVWMIRERKPKTSFLFSPGATCPVGYSGAVSFLDLNWLLPR